MLPDGPNKIRILREEYILAEASEEGSSERLNWEPWS